MNPLETTFHVNCGEGPILVLAVVHPNGDATHCSVEVSAEDLRLPPEEFSERYLRPAMAALVQRLPDQIQET